MRVIRAGFLRVMSLWLVQMERIEFMVPTLHQSFEAYRKKVDLGVHSAAGSVSVFSLNV
jgi:hypothetical protein